VTGGALTGTGSDGIGTVTVVVVGVVVVVVVVLLVDVVVLPVDARPEALPDEVDACRRFLDGQVGVIGPRVVITLGNFAMRSLLNTTDGITRRRGSAYRFASGYVIPTFHPAAALRGGPSVVSQMREDFRHAAAALLRGGR